MLGFDAVVGNLASPYGAGSSYVLLHHVFGEVNGKPASLFCQQVAPEFTDGSTWDAHRETVADLTIDTVEAHAPGFKAKRDRAAKPLALRSGAHVRLAPGRYLPWRHDTRPAFLGPPDAGICQRRRS